MALYRRGYTWWMDIHVRGKRIRKSTGTTSRTEAEEIEQKMTLDFWNGNGGYARSKIEGDSMSLKEAFERAFEEHFKDQRQHETYLWNAKTIMEILGSDLDITTLDEKDITRLKQALKRQGNQDGTINRKLSLLQKVLKLAAFQWKVRREVPVVNRLKEPPGRIRVLTKDEEDRLIDYFGKRGEELARDLVIVLLDTGARLGEMLTLETRDVNFKSDQIHIWRNKGDRPRSVPMTKRVRAIFEARKEAKQPFGEIDKQRMEYLWSCARKALDLGSDTKIHSLRHTTATRLVNKGVDLYRVQKWMGHSTIKVTEKYAHLSPAVLNGARDILEDYTEEEPQDDDN